MNAHQLNLSSKEEQEYQQETLSLLCFIVENLGCAEIQKDSLQFLKSRFSDLGDCLIVDTFGEGCSIKAYDPVMDEVRTFIVNLASESIHETF